MFILSIFLAAFALSSSAFAAFGITTTSSGFVVDAGSKDSLKVTIDSSSCDITSILYRNEEFQSGDKRTQLSSGLGSATVKADTINGTYAKITCTTSTLTHYIVVKSGEATLYMATYTTAEPTIGELRFIARLQSSKLPLEYPFGKVSTTTGTSASTIEGKDVFLVDGETRSKFYSSERFINDTRHCVYRDGTDPVRACMLLPNPAYESSSGGPFFRDINSNNADSATNLYFYMNSGHAKTEDWRQGLHGPYALSFNTSSLTSSINEGRDLDTSFFSGLDISGYVPASGRGRIIGYASGVPTHFTGNVHWYNDVAQYWTETAFPTGSFTSPLMKPGTYTMISYREEFPVANSTVTVVAGKEVAFNLTARVERRTTVWQIGEWDGQPRGFRNADKQLRMHPSDKRMSDWGLLTYTVGSSPLDDVPMALFKGVNTPLTINFTLTAAQASAASKNATLRIGTTLSFSGGRPQAKINRSQAAAPPAPRNLNSRGVTRGTYRGLGEVYDFVAATLKEGVNTVTIDVIGGSGSGGFLNPNVVLDAIELFTA